MGKNIGDTKHGIGTFTDIKNIGFLKITGNIGDFYENIGEFHQFQKYRRNWPFLQELQEIQNTFSFTWLKSG